MAVVAPPYTPKMGRIKDSSAWIGTAPTDLSWTTSTNTSPKSTNCTQGGHDFCQSETCVMTCTN
jgi:hypothetical protein